MLILTSSNVRPLFVISGESNSGGLGYNSDIPVDELLPNPKVQIWDNDTNAGFQPLQIGVNNLRGHTGLTGVSAIDTTRHGLERSLALDAKKQIWLVKTGQGGSRIGDWTPGGTYSQTFVSRVTASMAAMRDQRLKPFPVFIWWQGVNDSNDGSIGPTWRSATEAHFARVRTLLGANTPIFALKIMPNTANKIITNQQIDLLAGNNTYPVSVSAADDMIQGDTHHWTAQGFRACGQSLAGVIRGSIGSKSRL